MKIRYLIWVFLLVMLVNRLYATVCGDKVYTCLDYDGWCVCTANNIPAYSGSLGNGCTATLANWAPCAYTYEVCCPDGTSSPQVVMQSFTYTDVPITDIEQTATDAWEMWQQTEASTPSCPANFHQTAYEPGMAYESYMGNSGNTATVEVTMWARAGCTADGGGNPEPLGNITDGYRQVTLEYDKLQDAFGNALSNSPLLGAINNSLAGGWGTGSGGGLTSGEMANAVYNGVSNALGSGSYNPLGMNSTNIGNAYSHSEISALGNINFSDRVSTFFSDMANATVLFSNISLVGLGNVTSGSSSVQFTAGQFGNVSFDFADHVSILNYVKGFMLLLGSYLSVRIIILKR